MGAFLKRPATAAGGATTSLHKATRFAGHAPLVSNDASESTIRAPGQLPGAFLVIVRPVIHIGVGVTKFDGLVASGSMPKPKRIDGRRVWDIVALDFADRSVNGRNGMPDQTWDDVDGA